MNRQSAKCPKWLAEEISLQGGVISFKQYMDLILNHPSNGYYASGLVSIGKGGDYVTSPALGTEFSEILSIQIIDWLHQLVQANPSQSVFSLIELGPGEGNMAFDLIREIKEKSPELIPKLQFILIEPNKGLLVRQKELLKNVSEIPVIWMSTYELFNKGLYGIVIAHEVLDVLPVDRIVFRNNKLFMQGITLKRENNRDYIFLDELPLNEGLLLSLKETLSSVNIDIPPGNVTEGWTTEWHVLDDFLFGLSSILAQGPLLIIDYALESKRYYSNTRYSGTMISYYKQKASSDLLFNPGKSDLTCHLCLETLIYSASKNGWNFVGETRQGQALLALGLAEKLVELQQLSNDQIKLALQKRENLLRLVDPFGLGEFRWIVFDRDSSENDVEYDLKTKFLDEP